MTPARTAEVLRGISRKPHVLTEAERRAVPIGADALEFQEWLFGYTSNGWLRIWGLYLSRTWQPTDSFLDYARAEWEKERKG
jgi:hypothetical protein